MSYAYAGQYSGKTFVHENCRKCFQKLVDVGNRINYCMYCGTLQESRWR